MQTRSNYSNHHMAKWEYGPYTFDSCRGLIMVFLLFFFNFFPSSPTTVASCQSLLSFHRGNGREESSAGRMKRRTWFSTINIDRSCTVPAHQPFFP